MSQNLGDLVLEAAAAYGDDIAFLVHRRFRHERITFHQTGVLTRQVATWLLSKGLSPGDRIVIWAPNMPQYALLYFGAWLAGVVVVPIDVRSEQATVDRFVQDAAPRLGFKSEALPGAFGPPVEETIPLERLLELVADVTPAASLPEIGPQHLCEITFTSGTTGVPKGVMLTHGNLLAETAAMHVAFPLQRGYRALSLLPLSHALEQTITLLLAYTSGVRVSYVSRVNTVTIARAMREGEITCLVLVPELLRRMLAGMERRARESGRWGRWQAAHRLAPWLPFPLRRLLFRPVHQALGGHLLFFGCGGAPLDVSLAQAWERMGIRVYEGYGLTETSAAAAINRPGAQRLGTVGRPIPGVEVRLAEDGEILLRGPTVSQGYYNRPEVTAQTFTDGWFHSGDVGRFDPDGYLRVTGRSAFKLVMADGRNVYPEDVERVLNQHPLVKESCVVGVERPSGGRAWDGRSGDVVHAVLLTDAEEQAGEIVRWANRQLASHQQISGSTVWPEEDLPRTPTLKVNRELVRTTVQRRLAGLTETPAPAQVSRAPAPATPGGDRLRELIAEVAGQPVEVIDDAAALEADLGLDSLGRVEVLSLIEEELGREVDETSVGPHTTVGELRSLLAGRTASASPADGGGRSRWPRSRWARAVRPVLQWLLFRLQDRWMRIDIVHPERVATIPFPSILIFNYQGPYAALALLRALPRRLRERVAIGADARLWEGRDRWQGILGELAVQAFPFVKSGGAVRPSLELLGRYLDDGYAVIMSPEGNPEIGGELLPFLGGTGLMAVEMGVPVVPFKLEGYHHLFPTNPPFPYLPIKRGRVRLIIGEPVTFPPAMPYEQATAQARQALIETH